MARINNTAELATHTIKQATDWYAEQRIPRALASAHPAALHTAHRLAGGDWRRVVRDEDGALVVLNYRW